MNKPPAFQFYPDNFVAGTAHMTTEEVGAYWLLLCYQWNAGSVPNDDEAITRITRIRVGFPLGSIKAKFEIGQDGNLRNARLERERQKQIEFRENQQIKGKLGGRPKGLDNPSLLIGKGSGLPKQSSPSSSPSPSSLNNTHTKEACVPPKSKGGGGNGTLEKLQQEVAALYQRPEGQAWSYQDQHGLFELSRRPNVLDEWAALKLHRLKLENPKYFPNSVSALIEGWEKTLDASRTHKYVRQKTNRVIV